MDSFLKFSGMIQLLILVLINYEEWDDNESTQFISQTKQKKKKMMG